MQGGSATWSMLFTYALIFAVFYFILIAPQRKREKQIRDMLASLKEGDEIITVGGIMGKVIHIKDDEVSIETALERTKIKIARWAIKSIEKPVEEEQKNPIK